MYKYVSVYGCTQLSVYVCVYMYMYAGIPIYMVALQRWLQQSLWIEQHNYGQEGDMTLCFLMPVAPPTLILTDLTPHDSAKDMS